MCFLTVACSSFGRLCVCMCVCVCVYCLSCVLYQVLTSLKAEVSILASLRHPNVVLYIGACTRPPNVFIVTEWCERGGLNDLIYDLTRPISALTRINFALQTALGMCYLHRYTLRTRLCALAHGIVCHTRLLTGLLV